MLAHRPIATADISPLIHTIRGQRVILDVDLARLYGVFTGRLNEQVKRNRERFPGDFMFQLSPRETLAWQRSRSQIAILKRGGNIKFMPHAFTEHGVLMAANVLNSPQAMIMSVEVVRAFVQMRRMTLSVETLARKMVSLERKLGEHDGRFKTVFDALRQLMTPPSPPRRRIGLHASED